MAINTLGVIAGYRGDIEEEIKCYKKAIELNPDSIEAYINLAYAYEKDFNDEEAIKYFKKVIEMDPDGKYVDEARDMLKDLGA